MSAPTLTTGTFNLIVKDRKRLPPERGVFSPHEPLAGICASSKPSNVIALARKRQPHEITGFPPDFNNAGAFRAGSRTLTGRTIYGTRRNALPWVRAENFGASRHGSHEFIKDRLEVLLLAKPFRDLVPECEPRDPGSNRGFLNWMPLAPASIQQTPGHTLAVLDLIVYTKLPRKVQAGNQKS